MKCKQSACQCRETDETNRPHRHPHRNQFGSSRACLAVHSQFLPSCTGGQSLPAHRESKSENLQPQRAKLLPLKPKGTYMHQSLDLEKYVSSNKMIILSDCATKAGTAFNAWHLRSKFSWSMQSRSNQNDLLDSRCPRKYAIAKASTGHQYRLPDRRLSGSCATALKLPERRTRKITAKMQAKNDKNMAKSKFRK